MGRLAAALFAILATGAAILPATTATTSSAGVASAPPRILEIDLSANDDEPGTPGIQIYPVAGGNRNVVCRILVEDPNGASDIDEVDVKVRKPNNGSSLRNADAEDPDTASGTRAWFTVTFPMKHGDKAGEYTLEVTAEDEDDNEVTAWTTFWFKIVVGLTLSSTSLPLGSVEPGGSTHAAPVSLSVTNAGNEVVDLQYNGTDLRGPAGALLPVGSVKLSLDAGMADENALSLAPKILSTFNLAPESSRLLYFDVHAPTGLPKGAYGGTLTLAAVSDR